MTSKVILDPTRRALVTGAAMAATMMVVVDSTIANVALPHIQSSMSASQDQSIWVLTSYLMAASIATPLSAWLAGRFGRKRMMMFCVAGFTTASLGCGLAANLPFLVCARILQGLCGGGLVPMSQALLLDINPTENHGKAMAVYAGGSMLGPLIGPTLGGWLTDSFSWRWCFLVNLPFGLLSLVGMATFMRHRRDPAPKRFDWFGFVVLSVLLAAFQLVMDRGQQHDWFESVEIRFEAAIVLLCLYMTVVHMATAKDTFIRPQLFRDRNFVLGCAISAAVGIISYAAIPPMVVMMQNLLGYSAEYAGIISIPRGLGNIVSMFVVGKMIGKFDARWFLGTGLALNALGLMIMSTVSLSVNETPLLLSGLIQGVGSGLIFVPLSITVFTTLSSTYRNEGAAIYALTRNLGASIGISYLQTLTITNTAVVHSRLTEGVRLDNPIMALRMPDFDFSSGLSTALLDGQITREAVMVSYIDLFWLLSIIGVSMLPVVALLRPANKAVAPELQHMVE